MAALALVSDLVVQSQLSAAGERAGVTVEFARSVDGLLERAQAAQPRLVVVDLSEALSDLPRWVATVKELAPQASIVAFGPHVHRERLAEARDAGCDLVVSRGQFHAEMDSLLERFAR
jgi:DNA-binding NarL/FixJ family response regulator